MPPPDHDDWLRTARAGCLVPKPASARAGSAARMHDGACDPRRTVASVRR